MRTRTAVKIIGMVLMAALSLAACKSGSDTSGQDQETATGQSSYDKMVAQAPAHDTTYPMTRNNINFYTDTWNKPGALAYTYVGFPDSDGVFHASIYYVTVGLPTSMCTSLRPPYQFKTVDLGADEGDQLVPAPGSDGVFYSGNDCEWYYGKDAGTGSFLMYHVPMTALVQQFNSLAVGESFNHAIRGH